MREKVHLTLTFHYVAFLLLFLSAASAGAQKASLSVLRNGDLLFQNSECGPLCKAINEVTPAIYGKHFSHIGIVVTAQGQTFVVEATGDKVQKNTLEDFVARSTDLLLVGRLKKPYRRLIDSATAFAEAQLGVPYDEAFLYDNDKYYCAELLYDAFKAANNGKAFFRLHPMTFKGPHSKTFFPGWVEYYKKIDVPIPEGAPGCNPGSIGQSKKIKIYRYNP